MSGVVLLFYAHVRTTEADAWEIGVHHCRVAELNTEYQVPGITTNSILSAALAVPESIFKQYLGADAPLCVPFCVFFPINIYLVFVLQYILYWRTAE